MWQYHARWCKFSMQFGMGLKIWPELFNSLIYCISWNIYFATGWVEEWRRSEEQNIHSRMLRKVLPVFYWEHVDNGLLWVRVVDFRAYDYVPCKEIGNSNFDANALLGWWRWCSFSCKYVKTHEKFIYIKSFLFKLVVSVDKIIKLRRWLPLKQWLIINATYMQYFFAILLIM